MGNIVPPVSETRPPEPVRAEFAASAQKDAELVKAPGPAAQAAEDRRAMRDAEHSASLMPDQLVVEKDEAAGRFVQTRIDPATTETVLRYPSETQLAFSRAVAAYNRAQSES